MAKGKKIVLFTIGNVDNASSRIRGIDYIPYLEKSGYSVKWIPRVPEAPKNKLSKYLIFPLLKRWLIFKRLLFVLFAGADLFFIQKIFIPEWQLKILKRRKIPFVFDFDDAIYLSEIDNNAENKTVSIITLAQKVIVSNKVLWDFCSKHGVNADIITTPVDVERIKPKQQKTDNNSFTIGWIGSPWTTKYLEIIVEPLKEISKNNNIILYLVGADRSFNPEGIKIRHAKWEMTKESEYLQNFDIGIMPLFSDKYSEAKGGYKLLLYMAAGLPSIASPVGINKKIIIENKTGFLANNNKDWFDSIKYFIENPEKRIIFGNESRMLAETVYSREVCFKKLVESIES